MLLRPFETLVPDRQVFVPLSHDCKMWFRRELEVLKELQSSFGSGKVFELDSLARACRPVKRCLPAHNTRQMCVPHCYPPPLILDKDSENYDKFVSREQASSTIKISTFVMSFIPLDITASSREDSL